MILDSYYVLYHPESKTYLGKHHCLDASWETARRFDEAGLAALLSIWRPEGLLPHHPLCNLEKVRVEVVRTSEGRI